MPPPRPQSLPVFLLIRTAFQLLWRQRDDALRLGFIPALICFGGIIYGRDALTVVAGQMQSDAMGQFPPSVTFTVMTTLLITILAVALAVANWLRFTLLGPMGAVGLGLNIGRSHLGFVISLLFLLFAAVIAFFVLSMPILLLPGLWQSAGLVIAFLVIFVLATRLSPFVIGQAIGQPISLQQAWAASRGNGVSLATALILVQVPPLIAVELVSQILFTVGFASVAPLAMFFIGSVFQIASAILLAIVLGTAFRHLVGIRV
jgi:hypothetical protein